MVKRIIGFCLCLMLTTALFAGCGDVATSDPTTKVTQEKTTTENATTSAQETTITTTEPTTVTTTTAPTTTTTKATTTTKKVEDWKTAYLNYINSLGVKTERKYGFIYLNNDDIPDLIVNGKGTAEGNRIYSYVNGKIIQGYTDLYGGIYIPKSGLIFNETGRQGYYPTYVEKMTDNGFVTIFSALMQFEHIEVEDENGEIHYEECQRYYLYDESSGQDIEVTEKEFDDARKAAFDFDKSELFSFDYSYSGIRNAINNW